MLERLRLQNYQKHTDLKLQFDPKITTIVGESDQGKSSIIRAIRLLCLNQPLGSGYIQWGKESEGATLSLWVDGARIKRHRSKSQNLYKLGDTEYVNFKDGVPQPIAEVLCISSDNFQRQLDAPYWLSDTDGQVSRQLNEILNLSQIDEIVTHVSQGHRDETIRINQLREAIEENTHDREALDWVEDAAVMYRKLEAIESQSRDLSFDVISLSDSITKIRAAKAAAEVASQRKQALCEADEAMRKMRLMHQEYEAYQGQIAKLSNDLAKCKRLQIESDRGISIEDWKLLDQAGCLVKESRESLGKLEQMLKQLKQQRRKADDLEDAQIQAERELEGYLEKHRKSNCPVCKAPLKDRI